MFLTIIYEGNRILAGITMKTEYFSGMDRLAEYVETNPIRTVIGVCRGGDGFDVYYLEAIRKLDMHLLKATVNGILSGSPARAIEYDGMTIVSKAFEGNDAGNMALSGLYCKNIQQGGENRKYEGFRFVARADNFRLMEVISFVKGKRQSNTA